MADTASLADTLLHALSNPQGAPTSESTRDETDPLHALQSFAAVPALGTSRPPPEPLQNLGPTTIAGLTFPAPSRPPSQPQSRPPSRPPSQPASAGPDRKRSLDHDEQDVGGKRARIEQPGEVYVKSEEGRVTPDLDLEALMQNALANFDGNQPLINNHTTVAPAATPPARCPSASPEIDRFENRMMKASARSTYMIRTMSLPLLGNVAVQILLRLSQQNRIETELLLADTGSDFERDFRQLIDIFMPSRKVFSDAPLFFANELNITDSDDRETVRMSNLASAAASTFGANDVPLKDIHDHFLAIFVPEDGEYKGSLSGFFIGLKTHVFIDSLGEHEDSQHVIGLIDDLFPTDFEKRLTERSGEEMLNPDEAVLVSQIKERRDVLLNSVNDESIKSFLAKQYASFHFPEELSIFLRNHLSMVVEYADKYGVNIPISRALSAPLETQNPANGNQWNEEGQQQQESPTLDLAAMIQDATSNYSSLRNDNVTDMHEPDGLQNIGALLEQGLSSHRPELYQAPQGQTTPEAASDPIIPNGLASLIAGSLADGLGNVPDGLPNLTMPSFTMENLNTARSTPSQFKAPAAQLPAASYQPYAHASAPPSHFPNASGDQLPPNQSSPSSVLYEKARQAAAAKTNTTSRREGLSTTRRPWSPDEEKALMAGLDKVKGPHWSQILSLYGPNGTVSDVLKDRTQVQLKDKARNLKLFFLKTSSEMPYYLQSVTGELKTRAPTQAARKEAEEKMRSNTSGERKEFDAILNLATGLRDRPHGNNTAAAPRRGGAHINNNMRASANSGAGAAYRQQGTAAAPPVPIPASGKPETSDTHHVSRLPQIQPAPAPLHTSAPSNPSLAPAMAPASTPMASMQPPLQRHPHPYLIERQHHAMSHTQATQQPPPRATPEQSYSRPQTTADVAGQQSYAVTNPSNHQSSSDHNDAALFATLSAALQASPSSQT